MILKDLLYTLKGDKSFVCTNNDSWPEDFKRDRTHYGTLFTDIVKSEKEEIFNRIVKSISLTVTGLYNEYPVLNIILEKEKEDHES